MTFPQTRHTLIQRIAFGSTEEDWQQFLADYWRPVCRFAAYWGRLHLDDAEDVAAATFETLIRTDLLRRWAGTKQAKLRTLLCSVVRNELSNRIRKQEARRRRLQECYTVPDIQAALHRDELQDVPPEQTEALHAAWAEELLQSAVESLMGDYFREGRGDHFRVLYGRVCDRMTSREIAEVLGIPRTSAESFYKHARNRLQDRLEELVRSHVARYAPSHEAEEEFHQEWNELGRFLEKCGGLEETIRRAYEAFDAEEMRSRGEASVSHILGVLRARR